MLVFCRQTLLVACLRSLPGMMKKIRVIWTLQHTYCPFTPKYSHWCYSFRWDLHSHMVPGKSVSFYKARGNSEPRTDDISALVPVQFSLTADENHSAGVGRGKAKDRSEPWLFLWWVSRNDKYQYSSEKEIQWVTHSSGPQPGNTTYLRIHNTELSHS